MANWIRADIKRWEKTIDPGVCARWKINRGKIVGLPRIATIGLQKIIFNRATSTNQSLDLSFRCSSISTNIRRPFSFISIRKRRTHENHCWKSFIKRQKREERIGWLRKETLFEEEKLSGKIWRWKTWIPFVQLSLSFFILYIFPFPSSSFSMNTHTRVRIFKFTRISTDIREAEEEA